MAKRWRSVLVLVVSAMASSRAANAQNKAQKKIRYLSHGVGIRPTAGRCWEARLRVDKNH